MTNIIVRSFKSEEVLDIINGKKTLVESKNIPKGFKGWVYGYVTKAEPFLARYDSQVFFDGKWIASDFLYEFTNKNDEYISYFLNGTIPFRFWFDEYEKIEYTFIYEVFWRQNQFQILRDVAQDLDNVYLNRMCLEIGELYNYTNGKDLYAWHIKKLEILDKPMELSEFWKDGYDDSIHTKREAILEGYETLTKGPQSWQHAWVKE